MEDKEFAVEMEEVRESVENEVKDIDCASHEDSPP